MTEKLFTGTLNNNQKKKKKKKIISAIIYILICLNLVCHNFMQTLKNLHVPTNCSWLSNS